MLTYDVYSLDVWGNAEDGYEVNDRCKVGTIELDDRLVDADILAALDAGNFVHAHLCEVSDQSDEFMLFIDAKDGYGPVLQLNLRDEVMS